MSIDQIHFLIVSAVSILFIVGLVIGLTNRDRYGVPRRHRVVIGWVLVSPLLVGMLWIFILLGIGFWNSLA